MTGSYGQRRDTQTQVNEHFESTGFAAKKIILFGRDADNNFNDVSIDGNGFLYTNPNDYFVSIVKGYIPGHSVIHQFGRNLSVPNGSWQFVDPLGFTDWPLSSAVKLRIKSGGNSNDTATGSGAREIRITGLDGSGAEIQEIIATNGSSISASTTNDFIRVNNVVVTKVGTYGGSNEGDIVIESTVSPTDVISVPEGVGRSANCWYTVPANKNGALMGTHITVDSNKIVDFRCFTRSDILTTTEDMGPKTMRMFYDGIGESGFKFDLRAPEFTVPELTDIWFEALGDGGGSSVSVDMEILTFDAVAGVGL